MIGILYVPKMFICPSGCLWSYLFVCLSVSPPFMNCEMSTMFSERLLTTIWETHSSTSSTDAKRIGVAKIVYLGVLWTFSFDNIIVYLEIKFCGILCLLLTRYITVLLCDYEAKIPANWSSHVKDWVETGILHRIMIFWLILGDHNSLSLIIFSVGLDWGVPGPPCLRPWHNAITIARSLHFRIDGEGAHYPRKTHFADLIFNYTA
jgi:hypothetical protein